MQSHDELPDERRPLTVSLPVAAEILGWPRSTVYDLAARNELPFRTIKAGKRRYVPVADLDEWRRAQLKDEAS